MKINYKGYHGTSVDIAKKIIGNDFELRNAVWFGKGAYFFKDSSRLAEMWARKRFKTKAAVIESDIEVENKYSLDLRDPSSDDCRFFHEVREEKISEGIKIKGDNYRFDIFIIEFIHQQMNIDVFLANTYTYEEFDDHKDKKQRTRSRIPNGTEIIVKNTDLIIKKMVI